MSIEEQEKQIKDQSLKQLRSIVESWIKIEQSKITFEGFNDEQN